jgi:hypothetical protein
MITKKQLAAVIKAVKEGGDNDDEITEDEAIAILQDTGLDAEIPFVREYALTIWRCRRGSRHASVTGVTTD